MEQKRILAAKSGDESAFAELTKQYAPLIDSMTGKYLRLFEGAEDYEDLRQEAVLAFYRAVCSYDPDRAAVSFGLYAKICLRNRMVSLLRKNHSEKKHNTTAAKLEETATLPPRYPSELRALSETAARLLTPYEKTVLFLYLDGKSYREIALSLGRTEKSVDNALFRAKSKLKSGYSM